MTTQRDLSSRFWSQRHSRRRVMATAAITGGGLAAGTLFGCTTKQTEPKTEAPVAKQPKMGGIVTRAGGPGAGSSDTDLVLDPHIDTPFTGKSLTIIYQGLLGYDPRTWELTPEIATRWEQPSQTEYIFRLQPGVKWHDKPPAAGRELTAEDVIFSLERLRSDSPDSQRTRSYEVRTIKS